MFSLLILTYFQSQKSLKQEHYLWQLFNIEKDITKANEDLEGEQRIRKEIVDELGNYESETSKKKKVQSGYLKEIAQCERRIAEKKMKLDKNVRVYPSLLFFVYPCCVYIYESSPPLLPCYMHLLNLFPANLLENTCFFVKTHVNSFRYE